MPILHLKDVLICTVLAVVLAACSSSNSGPLPSVEVCAYTLIPKGAYDGSNYLNLEGGDYRDFITGHATSKITSSTFPEGWPQVTLGNPIIVAVIYETGETVLIPDCKRDEAAAIIAARKH